MGNKIGKGNSNWKDGEHKDKNTGYCFIRKPDHPFCRSNGYISKHRLMMEEYIGRYLTKDEVVHHKNGITEDNRIENLELIKNNKYHILHHRQHQGPKKNNSSGFKGVCWHKRRQKWAAEIQIHKKQIYLGYYPTKELAACVYDLASYKELGDKCYLNKVIERISN